MTLEQQKGKIQQLAKKRRQEQAQPAPIAGGSSVRELVTSFEESLTIPARIRSVEELVRLLAQLQQLKDSLGGYAKIDISINVQDQEQ